MPAPAAVAWALLELVTAAISAYEMYDLGKTLYDGIADFDKNLSGAKEEVKKFVEALEKEIGANIDEKTEQVLLHALTDADGRQQSEDTKKAQGRRGDASTLIVGAIQQKVPFRKVISRVCEQANRVPVIGLRRKKGVTVKDLPQAKKRILLEILRVGLEEIGDIEDIDSFIVVRMKQLMASLLFEFIDDLLDWKTPLKAEACFGPAPDFADPKLNGSTRLYRAGSLNPFYPLPYRERNSLAADLVIPDYRREPLKKDNLFAIVEIKFEGDRIENRQFEQYDDLNKKAANVKTAKTLLRRTFKEKGVTKGCRVALFRYPEDIAIEPKDDGKKPQEQQPRRRRGPGKHKKGN